ncbi:UNVERIFIED_CONTAM: Serine/threonine-protein kinase UCNL [Sesamum radiatum]|uniref:non-specific serine/threonine protein kinase n=1 Tax=Sesamum radiatum TaxID=300843 RepID=A0AAW2W1G3_SESRA
MDRETHNTPPPELHIDNLRAVKVLGKGATGTVFLVYDNSSHQPFALKVVEKSSSLHHHADRRARHEISVLSRLSAAASHPFLPHLIGSSETQEFIYWAIPFCPGGDLNVLRYRQSDHVFSPAVIRFYLAEIICALQHLHERGIVYRDLKPENILVQQSGHVTLTDFDLSRDLVPRKSGNPNFYSDPEEEKPVKHPPMNRKITRFVVPKRGGGNHAFHNKKGLKKAKSARVSPVSRRNPNDFSTNERSNSFVGTEEYVAPEVIRDLIGKLLDKDPTRRLGYRRGASEIKEHEFFRGLKWDLLTEVLRPPFLPSRDDIEMTEGGIGIDIREYFQKLKLPASPLWSPSLDECRNNVSLAEF